MQQNPPVALPPQALGLEEGSELLMTAGETAEQGNCLAGFAQSLSPALQLHGREVRGGDG